MAVAVFNSCCCCIQLRLGCLIYGYLELLGTMYYMITLLALPNTERLLVEELRKHTGDTAEMREFAEIMETVVRVGVIIAIICLCIKLIFLITFLVGLHKDKRSLVGVYLVFTAIFLIISFIVTIAIFVKMSHQDKIKIPDALWANQISTFVFTYLLSIYFWMVIRSHYHQMKVDTGNEQAVNYNTA